MSFVTLTELLTKLSQINELSVLSVFLLLIAISFIFTKLKSKKIIRGYSSIDLQDNEKNIKYRGHAFGAILIILLNYFKRKRE